MQQNVYTVGIDLAKNIFQWLQAEAYLKEKALIMASATPLARINGYDSICSNACFSRESLTSRAGP